MTSTPREPSTSDADVATTVRLSAQRALLAQVPASLRAVSVATSAYEVRFRCFFDTSASDTDRELLSDAATEIIADFSAPWTISEEYLTVPAPEPMQHLEHLVFMRHEWATPVI